jgi:hypothetical protein
MLQFTGQTSRNHGRRKEAGAQELSFELLNRNVEQPFKYVATWLIDEWSKIGLQVTQRALMQRFREIRTRRHFGSTNSAAPKSLLRGTGRDSRLQCLP